MADSSLPSPARIVFEAGAESRVAAELESLGAQRVFAVCQPGHRDGADRIAAALGARAVGVFDRAETHVPRAVADEAVELARNSGADWILAHGGGSAVGVAKAIALELEVSIAAVVTSYAGSERTNMWGITEGARKTTGRDDRVRPRLLVYDPDLTMNLPRDFSLQSLFNALAHAIEALYATDVTPEAAAAAGSSLAPLLSAIRTLARDPKHRRARHDALWGASLAGEALGGAGVALHHKLAHVLGGTLGTPHALTHAVLLPYTIGYNLPAAPGAHAALAALLHTDDPAAGLYDLLDEVGLPTSLRQLEVPRRRLSEVVEQALAKPYANPRPIDGPSIAGLLEDAWHGRRPSIHTRRVAVGVGQHALDAAERGVPLSEAKVAILAVHGRGGASDRMLRKLERIVARTPDVTLLAPQASDASWYPAPFCAPPAQNQPALGDALQTLDRAWAYLRAHLDPSRILVVGFSQGACLAMSWLADRAAADPGGHAAGGLFALAGAHIDLPAPGAPLAGLATVPVYWSRSERDPWLPEDRVRQTEQALDGQCARLQTHVEPGDAHRIHPADAVELAEAVERLRSDSELRYLAGLGNALSSEARPGTLPRHQNAPREVPYGLYAEQLNGTGFTVERALNRRVWMYRLRPAVLDRPWAPTDAGRIVSSFTDAACPPQIERYQPTPLPAEARDFVQGLTTFAGAGDPTLKTGMAIHLYAASADMGRRSLANVDGDLLVAPWDGALRIRTELGLLDVGVGEIAVIPRGLRFSVAVPRGSSRGFVAELYMGHLQLPERGLIGANGLADERHFQIPVADFEDIEAEHELLIKHGGAMWRNTCGWSPFDVVAWHGKYVPFKYDLRDFNTLGTVSFDHPDPSILTVLTAPTDTHGRSALDVAVFKGRWDASEHTFRPPFFHRNSAIEFNMVINAPRGTTGPWQPGAFSYTPYLVPHGVSERGYRESTAGPDALADAPERIPEASMWLQFESTYLLRKTRWAAEAFAPDRAYLSSFSGFARADVPR